LTEEEALATGDLEGGVAAKGGREKSYESLRMSGNGTLLLSATPKRSSRVIR
jgi:hypothetical protein